MFPQIYAEMTYAKTPPKFGLHIETLLKILQNLPLVHNFMYDTHLMFWDLIDTHLMSWYLKIEQMSIRITLNNL